MLIFFFFKPPLLWLAPTLDKEETQGRRNLNIWYVLKFSPHAAFLSPSATLISPHLKLKGASPQEALACPLSGQLWGAPPHTHTSPSISLLGGQLHVAESALRLSLRPGE